MIPIFPTAYLPPVIYFALLLKFDTIIIETQETFPKQTWRNRCTILSAQGELGLSIPVVKPYGNKTKTADIEIDKSQKWQNNHWRAIESAYNKSPFFFYCSEEIKSLIYNDMKSLIEYNDALFRFFLSFFKIKITHLLSDHYEQLSETDDLRKILTPKNKPLVAPKIFPTYYQVFSDRLPFHPNLSILDLAVNEGPAGGLDYLRRLTNN